MCESFQTSVRFLTVSNKGCIYSQDCPMESANNGQAGEAIDNAYWRILLKIYKGICRDGETFTRLDQEGKEVLMVVTMLSSTSKIEKGINKYGYHGTVRK